MQARRLVAAAALTAAAATAAPAVAHAAPAPTVAPQSAAVVTTAQPASIIGMTRTIRFTAEQTRLLAMVPSCGSLPRWPIFTTLGTLLPTPLPCAEIGAWARKAVAAGKNLGMTVSVSPIYPYTQVSYFFWS